MTVGETLFNSSIKYISDCVTEIAPASRTVSIFGVVTPLFRFDIRGGLSD